MLPNRGDDRPPRRNARSLDLDDSAAKAAAWVWHLHESGPGVTTEGRFLSSQARRRSSSSSYRKTSRFRHEAATGSTETKGATTKFDAPMWDCGSSLYDTFELAAFGNWLDRRTMEALSPAIPPPPPPPPPPPCDTVALSERHWVAPLHEPSQITRARSLPNSVQTPRKPASKQERHATANSVQTARKPASKQENHATASGECVGRSRSGSFSQLNAPAELTSKRWSGVDLVVKTFKKVGNLHCQVSINAGCKQNVHIVELSRTKQRLATPPLWHRNVYTHFDGKSPTEWSNPGFRYRKEGDRKFPPKRGSSSSQSADNISVCLREGLSRKTKSSSCISAHECTSPKTGKLERTTKPTETSSSQSYHRHLHHHHHYHHHHHLHHPLTKQSVEGNPELLSAEGDDWLVGFQSIKHLL